MEKVLFFSVENEAINRLTHVMRALSFNFSSKSHFKIGKLPLRKIVKCETLFFKGPTCSIKQTSWPSQPRSDIHHLSQFEFVKNVLSFYCLFVSACALCRKKNAYFFVLLWHHKFEESKKYWAINYRAIRFSEKNEDAVSIVRRGSFVRDVTGQVMRKDSIMRRSNYFLRNSFKTIERFVTSEHVNDPPCCLSHKINLHAKA